jgi:hypothetical protein
VVESGCDRELPAFLTVFPTGLYEEIVMSVPKARWGHPRWIAYFGGEMKMSVKTDIRPLLKSKGAFGIPRQFFPHIEYLSGLVYGPRTSIDKFATGALAEKFLEDYMGRVDPLYRQHAHVLMGMWRHGVIHTYQPKVLGNKAATRRLGWLSYQGERKNEEVKLWIRRKRKKMTVSHLTPHVGKRTIDYFPVANNCLVRDLARVLDIIVGELKAEEAAGGTNLLTNMQDAAKYLRKTTTDPKNPFSW